MDDRIASDDGGADLNAGPDADVPARGAPAGAVTADGSDQGTVDECGECDWWTELPPVTSPVPRDPDRPYRSPQWRDLPCEAYPENDRLSNRLVANLPRNVRNHLMGERFDALERLDELDAALDELSRERLGLLDELDRLRATLWPIDPRSKGRRPPADHERALAPAAADARCLAGRRLRSMCMSILRRHGPLRLRDLHDLLHRYGYAVGGTEPVKVLADALGYEHDCGRARRVARGVYDADRRPGRGGPRGHGRDPLPPLAIPSEPVAAGPRHEGPPTPTSSTTSTAGSRHLVPPPPPPPPPPNEPRTLFGTRSPPVHPPGVDAQPALRTVRLGTTETNRFAQGGHPLEPEAEPHRVADRTSRRRLAHRSRMRR